MNTRALIGVQRGALVVIVTFSTMDLAAAQSCLIPSNDMIAWWTFDETSGTTSEDIVGSNDGVHLNGPTPSAGMVNGSLRFDGIDDYVEVPDKELWAFGAGAFTIEFWANFDTPAHGSTGQPGDVFISSDEGPFSVDKWFLALAPGSLEFHTNDPVTGPIFSPIASFSPETNRWYHLAVTRCSTQYTIFVDGVVSAVGTNVATIADADSPLTIGRALEFWGGFMNGRLDEMTMYRRALSTAEIHAIFAAGSAGKCHVINSNPIAPFCFGDGCGIQCPCSNTGAAGRGCKNSRPGNIGCLLTAVNSSGLPGPSVSVTANELGLKSEGMLAGSYTIFFQGTTSINNGLGSLSPGFDGLECVGGTVIRLGRIATMGGTNTLAGVAGVADLAAASQTLHYQAAYRNAVAFCTPATLNTSNGVQISWAP